MLATEHLTCVWILRIKLSVAIFVFISSFIFLEINVEYFSDFAFQFQFQGPNAKDPEYFDFSVDDGGQEPITMASKDRDLLAAAFTKFLLSNIGEDCLLICKSVFWSMSKSLSVKPFEYPERATQ